VPHDARERIAEFCLRLELLLVPLNTVVMLVVLIAR
jgi:hypothetical protein